MKSLSMIFIFMFYIALLAACATTGSIRNMTIKIIMKRADDQLKYNNLTAEELLFIKLTPLDYAFIWTDGVIDNDEKLWLKSHDLAASSVLNRKGLELYCDLKNEILRRNLSEIEENYLVELAYDAWLVEKRGVVIRIQIYQWIDLAKSKGGISYKENSFIRSMCAKFGLDYEEIMKRKILDS